ncbi:TPA: hypothetical protein GRR58_22085 [Vibrio parahaemolyticus]|uniref:hypothetical protein n=1 Tax=Vibrio parahaemolyticus TaxID=670 RepID=UPI001A1A7404|nr:hypothetical protein [Vibrio parahaemolyticus]EGQ8008892.1 hypothetical protein [Vibrio parahaemolyticus]EHK2868924.1 hypothetical protein [Vibrio parahaemolyticus]EJG0673738.1 hypothetical protein [Vibrio parahaemolyticus]ELA9534655.1 hypothetical protein [Vibrio parahaemolyticus]MCC3817768.1 hypothetical protein [Vibrio parahaemolyticus]
MSLLTSQNNDQSTFQNLVVQHECYVQILRNKVAPLHKWACAIRNDIGKSGLESSDKQEQLMLADALEELVNCVLFNEHVPDDIVEFLEYILPTIRELMLPRDHDEACYLACLMEWLEESYNMEFNLY